MPKKTGKTLIVVESPNKIKKISSYLGPNYIIRASYGHVMDLSTGGIYFNLGVNIEKDFLPKYKIIPDKKDKLASIIDATTMVDNILLATDPDREGEAIAWHLLYCLESCGKPIERISFNEITEKAIKKAVQNSGPLDKNLYDAQQARRVLDRIVGFMASSFLKDNVGPDLSAGRVQSVATKLITDKDKEIKEFVPDEFWNIIGKFKKDDDKFSAKYINKITNSNDANNIKLQLEVDTFSISKINSFEKEKPPLPPLTTSTLQQTASTTLGYKVSSIMRHAQSLYESGLITYMRTDSTRISDDALKDVRAYLDKNSLNKPKKANIYTQKDAAQDAHEAIRPTDVNKLPKNVFLSTEQQEVYRIIWERFVASQMNPAIYDMMDVEITSSSGHILKTTGKSLKEKGWLEIAPSYGNNDNDVVLPILAVGESIDCIKIDANQKFTQPPSRYNEASLVKELERRGIGRPSTYANIIETIKSRHYVELQGKNYYSTDIGNQVIDKLSSNFSFMKYNYTAKMETNLDSIAEGKLTYVEMLDSFFGPFQKECKKAQYNNAKDYGIPCPVCKGKTILKHGRYGFYMCCLDYPDCKGSVSVDLIDEKPVIKENFKKDIETEVECPLCQSGMYKVDGKFGPFYTCEKYPKCYGKRKVPYGVKCGKCENEMFLTIFNGEKKLACMGYPDCKNITDLPENAANDWVDPTNIIEEPKIKRPIKKILKARKNKK